MNLKKNEPTGIQLPAGIQYDQRYTPAQNSVETSTTVNTNNAEISDLQSMLSKLQKQK